jgi:hypothetical protein
LREASSIAAPASPLAVAPEPMSSRSLNDVDGWSFGCVRIVAKCVCGWRTAESIQRIENRPI